MKKLSKTAVIYSRVSTSRQADEGISIESQVEQSLKKASDLDAQVLKIFRDEGLSGRTANRPAFQSAISFCAFHNVDYFIVWNTSRFARNKIDAASHKKLLEDGGTKVIYVSINIDNETDEGWFSESIFEIIDEHYSRQIARDTHRSMMKNARDGFWNGGRVPFGYETEQVGQRKRLVIKDEEAVIVQEMFRMFFSGMGCKSIAMNLNDRGLLFHGHTWAKGSISYILKNPVYSGMIVFNRRAGKGDIRPESEWIMTKSHPAIVSEEDCAYARRLFDERAQDAGDGSPLSTFVFTGLLRCGLCGSPMQIESATGRNKRYHYYNCSQFQKKGECRSRRIAATEFDRWMLDIVIERILTPERMKEVADEIQQLTSKWEGDHSRRMAGISKMLKEAKRRRSNLFDILELHGKDAPNLGDLTLRLRESNENIKRLEESLLAIEQEEEPLFSATDEQVESARKTMIGILRTTEDSKRLRLLMSNVLEKILLNVDGVEISYRPERIMDAKNRPIKAVHSNQNWLPEQGSNLRPAD